MAIWNHADSWNSSSEGLLLYRGFSQKAVDEIVLVDSPTNRQPVSMPRDVQVQMDDWFDGKFGVRFRQRSMFTSGSISTAQGYARGGGEVRVLRATQDYCFCWSPYCHDLYDEFSMMNGESVTELLERLDFRSTDLAGAIRSKNEIMLVGAGVQCTRL